MLSVDEINNLKKENEELKSKLKRLQRQHKNVLDLAKKNADTNEYCLQELEKRLQPFQDDYFIGLNEKQIAKLAKKSIKLTTYNRKLEDCLEEIREAAKDNIEIGCLISGGWLEEMIDEVLDD